MTTHTVVPSATVAVAPTGTVLATWRASAINTVVTVQVTNTDAVQTLDCVLRRRVSADFEMAVSTLPDLRDIPALGTAAVDIETGAAYEVEVLGTASGAGLDALVMVVNKW